MDEGILKVSFPPAFVPIDIDPDPKYLDDKGGAPVPAPAPTALALVYGDLKGEEEGGTKTSGDDIDVSALSVKDGISVDEDDEPSDVEVPSLRCFSFIACKASCD